MMMQSKTLVQWSYIHVHRGITLDRDIFAGKIFRLNFSRSLKFIARL